MTDQTGDVVPVYEGPVLSSAKAGITLLPKKPMSHTRRFLKNMRLLRVWLRRRQAAVCLTAGVVREKFVTPFLVVSKVVIAASST